MDKKVDELVTKAKLSKKQITALVFACMFFVLLFSCIFYNSMEFLLNLRPNTGDISLDAMEVHFVDVGQGDCILIRFPNDKTMIIDSGPKTAFENLKSYINNVFFYKCDKRFDYALLTHSDEDHSGNMEFIIKNYKVSTFFRPRTYANGVEEVVGTSVSNNPIYCSLIKALNKSNIQIYFNDEEVLHINDKSGNRYVTWYSHPVKENQSTNELSPLLIVESYGKRVCLTGDASIEVEEEIMNAYELPDVDVLKLAHHGSKTSTSYSFLTTITPEHIVVSVGENSYGHPSEETLLNLAKYDKDYNKSTFENLHSTKEQGNIICYFDSFSDVKFTYVKDVNDFLFVDYYVIVLAFSFILITLIVITLK